MSTWDRNRFCAIHLIVLASLMPSVAQAGVFNCETENVAIGQGANLGPEETKEATCRKGMVVTGPEKADCSAIVVDLSNMEMSPLTYVSEIKDGDREQRMWISRASYEFLFEDMFVTSSYHYSKVKHGHCSEKVAP